MSRPSLTSTSLRSTRWRALAPRVALYALIAVLSIAGLRSIFAAPAEPAPAAAPPPSAATDLAATSFAEGFARVYLTWDSTETGQRSDQLATFTSNELDDGAGMSPAEDTSQGVIWTSVVGARHSGQRTLVTIAAQTTEDLVYLTVPVSRDRRGFLMVSAYPAFVGPPAMTRKDDSEAEPEVDDEKLVTVAERAVANYLAGGNENLLADLTPGAVVSLPRQRLRASDFDPVTWVVQSRRIAVVVRAKDDSGQEWTLRYELDVRKSDRWYVQSLEIDPTFEGG